jgi:hypothetical protein
MLSPPTKQQAWWLKYLGFAFEMIDLTGVRLTGVFWPVLPLVGNFAFCCVFLTCQMLSRLLKNSFHEGYYDKLR